MLNTKKKAIHWTVSLEKQQHTNPIFRFHLDFSHTKCTQDDEKEIGSVSQIMNAIRSLLIVFIRSPGIFQWEKSHIRHFLLRWSHRWSFFFIILFYWHAIWSNERRTKYIHNDAFYFWERTICRNAIHLHWYTTNYVGLTDKSFISFRIYVCKTGFFVVFLAINLNRRPRIDKSIEICMEFLCKSTLKFRAM